MYLLLFQIFGTLFFSVFSLLNTLIRKLWLTRINIKISCEILWHHLQHKKILHGCFSHDDAAEKKKNAATVINCWACRETQNKQANGNVCTKLLLKDWIIVRFLYFQRKVHISGSTCTEEFTQGVGLHDNVLKHLFMNYWLFLRVNQ